MKFHRPAAVFTAAAVLLCSTPQLADARAKLVAVFVPRSTSALSHDAKAVANQVAAAISLLDGYEARVVPEKGTPGESAAAAGAVMYVTGQLLNDQGEHATLVSFNTAGDAKVGTVDLAFADGRLAASPSLAGLMSAAAPTASTGAIDIPSGKQISVMMLADIGSRISQEGDSFAVQTTEDFYVDGKLVAPKGSPGYGTITHLKRAGSWHAGGELNFTVKRIVTPDGKDLLVDTSGPTADANKDSEHNGNEFGQYLMFGGLGVFSHRGNDILIKKGAQFHVYTINTQSLPSVNEGAAPAVLDQTLITQHG
jgi:hypothetical protein